jgi:hypothetical protein
MSPVFHFKQMSKVNTFASKRTAPLLRLPCGTPLTVQMFNNTLKALVKSLLGTNIGFSSHTLRRSGASYLFYAGASDSQLMSQGTWVSSCFRNYLLSSKFQPSPVQKAVDKFFM